MNSIPQIVTQDTVAWNTEFDMMKPDAMGELDAIEGYPFCPEMYFASHNDKCLYAAGWVTVKGPSYLTDAFLVGSEVEAIEDDNIFISHGGA